jgi:alpha-ketoglutarate-dependent 2,4-dichlorophenoxyacetate dioxygenase
MALAFRKLHPCFVAEASPVDLKGVRDEEALGRIRAGMDEFAVLVFRDQFWSDAEHLEFAERLDGAIHTKLGISALQKNRFGNEALGDISNLDENGEILKADDRRRTYGLGNRLWHTDASFQDPPGRYSMLSAKVVPSVGADTDFADMRAAYDALPDEEKARLEGLHAHHSIAHSRQTLGFEFSESEQEALRGAIHPLVRTIPRSRRRSLYLASHASRIVEWPVPEGRLLLRELIEHATQPQFVYRHPWRVGDLLMWDNCSVQHRAVMDYALPQRRRMERTTLRGSIPF